MLYHYDTYLIRYTTTTLFVFIFYFTECAILVVYTFISQTAQVVFSTKLTMCVLSHEKPICLHIKNITVGVIPLLLFNIFLFEHSTFKRDPASWLICLYLPFLYLSATDIKLGKAICIALAKGTLVTLVNILCYDDAL